jgi:hypothetical protein
MEKFKTRGKRAFNPRTIVKINPANGTEKDLNSPIGLLFNFPITAVNKDSMLFYEGKTRVPFTLVQKDTIGRKYEMECKLLNDSNYSLTILPGAFTACFGYGNDTTRSNFKVPSLESVGNIYLTISGDSASPKIDFKKEHLLLQLLNDKGEILSTQKLTNYQTISYLNFKPGSYKAQIIVDDNNNNQWDTGNFLKKQQAEKIILMGATMSLRANWDLEEEWKFGLK